MYLGGCLTELKLLEWWVEVWSVEVEEVEDVWSGVAAAWPSGAEGAVEAGDCGPVGAAGRGKGAGGAEVAAAGTWLGWMCPGWVTGEN